MLDRASTFADAEVLDLLKTQFVSVAIDQAYQRRQNDAEGDFYRKIAQQGRPTKSRNETTQGLYAATADGRLLGFTNNRSPAHVRRMLEQAAAAGRTEAEAIEQTKADPRYSPQLPEGGLIVRVQARVLDGYPPPQSPQEEAFQTSLSRDNLWITPEEHRELTAGRFPAPLLTRIARFHLVDNTRGEPPMWRSEEIRSADAEINADGQIVGSAELSTKNGRRTYKADLFGRVETERDQVTRFDMVCRGTFTGRGAYTGHGPPGPFTLAISFTLADGSDAADAIPPQGSRGWIDGYLDPSR